MPRSLLALVTALLATLAAASAASAAPVTVSLEFDDGLADHAQAAQILQAHGLRGVFYINSSRLDSTGYLTTAQAQAIQAAGHEIGGHTLTHQNLPTIPVVEQRREICDDRVALLNQGFKVENLAYPFGASNAGVETIAQACGYNSARITSGIRSPAGCFSCPWAESLTPPDVYAMRIPQSVRTTTTLATIEGYVTGARDHGGGWIQILMHHICDAAVCDENSITPANLDALAAWLHAQPDVTVRTVAKVIDGPRKAGVAGPPRPVPSGAANVLADPSLEDTVAATPACWRPSSYKVSDGVWTPTTDARTGARAWRLDVTSLSTGAANRLLSLQDNGFCAPSATVGARYTVGAWVKGTAPVRLSAYRRAPTAAWSSWASGPEVANDPNTYKHVTWTTPLVPALTTSLSVGIFELRHRHADRRRPRADPHRRAGRHAADRCDHQPHRRRDPDRPDLCAGRRHRRPRHRARPLLPRRHLPRLTHRGTLALEALHRVARPRRTHLVRISRGPHRARHPERCGDRGRRRMSCWSGSP